MKELEAFAENANAVNRLFLNHFSISEAYRPHTFKVGELPWEEDDESSPNNNRPPVFSMPSDREDPLFHDPMFSIGNQSFEEDENSSEEEVDVAPILWMGLTPPGTSGLARRRLQKISSGDSSDGDKENKSPPKVPSAIF